MSQLEEKVGVKLFHRGARRIALTNEGILLRRRAEEILSLVDKTERELTFSRKYPLVTYDIYTANADLVKEQMEKGLVDTGILLEPIDIGKFDFLRLNKKERWVVLMPPNDPLAEKEAVVASDFEGRPIILPRRMNVQNELANWFGDSFGRLHVLFTSNLSTNSAIMVRKGLGYSFVIEGAVPFWDKNEIISRPLSPELSANSVIAWEKQQPFSLAVTKSIEHIKLTYAFKA